MHSAREYHSPDTAMPSNALFCRAALSAEQAPAKP
jgi:hypothetical protein